MPIVARQPGPETAAGSRSGIAAMTGLAAPPEDLLPSSGAPVPAPALAPHRALALDAVRIRRTLHAQAREALPWAEPAFAREVESVRRQLGPIRSRRGLAASFAREASQPGGPERTRAADPLRPLRVAYALRWLELGDGVARAGWIELVTDPG